MSAVRLVVTATLSPWERDWDALVDAAPLPTPFLRSWWLGAIADHRARFLLVTDGTRLIGGLALEQHRSLGIAIFRTCGAGALRPDHVDLLAAPGSEQVVIAEIRRWFARSGPRVLDVAGVVEDSLLATSFAPHMSTAIDVAPWEPLPSRMQDYLRLRSAAFRTHERRASRHLSERGVSFGLADIDDTERLLDAFAALHALLPDPHPLMRQWFRLRPALLAGAYRREVQFFAARHGAEIVAITVAFRTSGRLCLYQHVSRGEAEYRGASKLVELAAIAHGCASGCSELDLLRGDGPDQRELATNRRTLSRVRIGTGRAGRAWVVGRAGVVEARSGARHIQARRTDTLPESVE